jgi:chorismate synthase
VLRYLTAGESHGPMLVAILEGLPAGVPVRQEVIDARLRERQAGPGRGGRQRIERDSAELVAGVRAGETMGGPVGLLIRNRDWENWQGVLGASGVDPERAEARALYRPRPGHADLAGALKYDRHDLRDVLERASARETAARVAVGAICQELLEAVGISVLGHVLSLGPVEAPPVPEGMGFGDLRAAVGASDCRCWDPGATAAMHEAVREATLARDTLGGRIEVRAVGVPPGLGSYASSDRRLDGRLAGALMSIQAMKAVEVGVGVAAARLPGSAVHDEIVSGDPGPGGWTRYRRPTNRAGGLEGGVTNGEPLLLCVSMKPIPTLLRPLRSVDMRTGEVLAAGYERSDVTSVPAASVVAEGVAAFVLCQALLEKFGGDSLGELRRNLEGYRAQVRAR